MSIKNNEELIFLKELLKVQFPTKGVKKITPFYTSVKTLAAVPNVVYFATVFNHWSSACTLTDVNDVAILITNTNYVRAFFKSYNITTTHWPSVVGWKIELTP